MQEHNQEHSYAKGPMLATDSIFSLSLRSNNVGENKPSAVMSGPRLYWEIGLLKVHKIFQS